MAFKKGEGGRPVGAVNKATVVGKDLCLGLLTDPAYLKGLKKRLLAGKLPPAVECKLWDHAFGRPKERLELSSDKTLSQLILDALGVKDDREMPNENELVPGAE